MNSNNNNNEFLEWRTSRPFNKNKDSFQKNVKSDSKIPYVKGISYKAIDDLQNKPPEKILLELLNPIFGLDNYLSAETLSEDLAYKLTLTIVKSYDCNSMPTKQKELTNKILDSKFFKTVLYDLINKRNPRSLSYNSQLVEIALNLLTQFIILNPYSINNVSPMRDRLEILIFNRIKNSHLKNLFEDFLKLEQDTLDRIEKRKNKTFTNIDLDSLDPSDDFTNLNIVPKFSDILVADEEVFLRKNITNGSYKNVHHYLDIQFRLLREDFMKPLRDGVCEFRKIIYGSKNQNKLGLSKEVMQKIKKIDYLNTYFDVFMSKSIAGDHGIVYEMKLDKKKLNSIHWETSRRLMFGSLVCFSSDYFLNECLVGVVCERDAKSLNSSGIFNVKFDYDPMGSYLMPELSKNYVMLETSAFFESYKHVLKALQSFQREGEEYFPFKENLVYCQNRVIPYPNYLKGACIDFRPLVDENKKCVINRFTLLNDYEFSSTVSYAEKCFMANSSTWPTAQQMKLDRSQYEAVKLALTNKLALIQGPPGTGKTFLGVKIIQLLLHNKNSWWNKDREKHKPILMICYTNHALDQFLEYCVKECSLTKGIVRVGGRSKAEYLEPFLLKNIKRDLKTRRQIDRSIYYRVNEELSKVRKLRAQINELSTRLSSIFNGDCLVSYDEIAQYIRDDHIDQLVEYGSPEFKKIESGKNFNLLEWLGLFDLGQDENFIKNFEDLNLDLNMGKIVSGLNDDRDEDDEIDRENSSETNEVQNEQVKKDDDTDSINEERMLEDDFDAFENLKSKQIAFETKFNTRITGLIQLECLNEMIRNYKLLNGLDNTVWKKKVNGKIIQEDMDQLKTSLNFIFSNLSKKYTLEDLSLIENSSNIWRLSYPERFLLYFQWLNKYKEEKLVEIKYLSDEYNQAASSLQELRLQEDRFIMEDAFIIAMTTTGSSRYHSILKDIGPRIVIVEEAAEVFEAHIVSSLSKHCEHLILIGDHVQLRPNPAVYNLATKYLLDVSLFERLINNDTKRVMLTNQHRLRPEISFLMQNFYDHKIQDDPSVQTYPKIHGLTKNVFFIEHSQLEKRLHTTKINIFEAEYLVKLCQYLVKQNYNENNITVLTMYLGQMMEIKKNLKNLNLSKIKVSTVDNYQGEENDIVLLSLVRSNNEGKIGFLNIKNRVCVALSRAKHGFYAIGNFDFIIKNEKGDIWTRIVKSLKEKSMIGQGLMVTCGSHPKQDMEICQPDQFEQRPNGGCSISCDYRLKCGHKCSMKCHGNYDREHLFFKCIQTCNKKIEKCGHNCQKICSSRHDCIECLIYVNKIIPECGHSIKFRCDKEPKRENCNHPCKNVLECGHLCTKLCRDLNCGKCLTKLNVDSVCKHGKETIVLCSDLKWEYKTKCKVQCDEQLSCGHRCTSTCGGCYSGLIHAECTQKCNGTLFCGHKCKRLCFEPCQPCDNVCENECEHSKCPKKCSEPCSQCKEKCKNSCKHSKCTKLCHEICDRKPCDEPCTKKLRCGHECIGLFGELCPKLCRICKKEKVNEFFFGTESNPDSRFIYLKDCGHVLEVSGLDNWINSRYDTEQNKANLKIQSPDCPKCKTPIRRNKRYINIIKKQIKLIEEIKMKYVGDSIENENFKKNLLTEIENFDNNSPDAFNKLLISSINKQRDSFSYNTLAAYQNTWNIFNKLKIFFGDIKEKDIDKFDVQNQHVKYEIEKISKILLVNNEVVLIRQGQRLNDIICEIDRIGFLLEFYRLSNLARLETTLLTEPFKVAVMFEKTENLLVKNAIKCDSKIKSTVENLLKSLSDFLQTELDKRENLKIIKEISLCQEDWYKCSCGHVFCSDSDFQQKKCKECQQKSFFF